VPPLDAWNILSALAILGKGLSKGLSTQFSMVEISLRVLILYSEITKMLVNRKKGFLSLIMKCDIKGYVRK